MKAKWQVVLVKPPLINDFASDYFPRTFYYKKDAMELKAEVEHKGGLAEVKPASTDFVHMITLKCGDKTAPRRCTPNEAQVTCPRCRAKLKLYCERRNPISQKGRKPNVGIQAEQVECWSFDNGKEEGNAGTA